MSDFVIGGIIGVLAMSLIAGWHMRSLHLMHMKQHKKTLAHLRELSSKFSHDDADWWKNN